MFDAQKFVGEMLTSGFAIGLTAARKITVAPSSRLSNEQRAALKLHKAQIVRHLSPRCEVCNGTASLDELVNGLRVWFCPLGCGIVRRKLFETPPTDELENEMLQSFTADECEYLSDAMQERAAIREIDGQADERTANDAAFVETYLAALDAFALKTRRRGQGKLYLPIE